ncbi:MAG TPA: hypothetical protein VKN36_17215 [Eudoraea sp.]|nr:hypothetical protein [Eudoraea sp.]
MKKSIIIISLIAMGCNSDNTERNLTNSDIEKIKNLHENYRGYWLENDSAKVVSLFSEKGGLIPPQNPGNFVIGQQAISEWWFSVIDHTTYPITDFVYKSDTLLIVDSKTAIYEGVSTVSWKTMRGDSVLSTSTSSSNFVTICIKEDYDWKILRQIWNVRPD